VQLIHPISFDDQNDRDHRAIVNAVNAVNAGSVAAQQGM
jgi:hypothetical protein